MPSFQFRSPAQALDGDGRVLPGATLAFSSGGNPVHVSADVYLKRPHRNPLVSNSAGRFPQFHLDPDVAYRAILETADGDEIFDENPYVFYPGTDILKPLDDSGRALPFATLTVYLFDTTELATIYSDGGLTTPADNPATADETGLFATLYLDDEINYRVILKDQYGRLIYDIDIFFGNEAVEEVSFALIEIFSESGTWTKPSGAAAVQVILVGAGGGGGSGGVGFPGGSGGGGGGGGGVSEFIFRASDLDSSVAVTIGSGGAGGASVSGSTNINGNDGSAGGDSAFGDYLVAGGGAGGLEDKNDALGGPGGSGNKSNGGAGGRSNASSGFTTGVLSTYAPSGGGGGGLVNSVPAVVAAADGGDIGVTGATLIEGGTSGGTTTDGSPGNSLTGILFGSGGGGGRAIDGAGGQTAGAGGAGQIGAGGGGGGGNYSAPSSGTSGTGGLGGNGIAMVISYF